MKKMKEPVVTVSKQSAIKSIILLACFVCLGAMITVACALNRSYIPDNVGKMLSEEEQAEIIARNSPLTEYVHLSPNAGFPRKSSIKKITIHHMAGDFELENLGMSFASIDRRASSNYAIDKEGRVALYVEECNMAWTSSSEANDNQAITIEVANNHCEGNWPVSKASYDKLIELVVDVCQRNGIEELVYTGDDTGNLTLHNMFSDTECPGPYLLERIPELVEEVNSRLMGV